MVRRDSKTQERKTRYDKNVKRNRNVCVCACVYVCVYSNRQTDLVDVRQVKRNTLRQTNKNRKKESVEIKEKRRTDRGRKEILKKTVMKGKWDVGDEWGHREAGSDKE